VRRSRVDDYPAEQSSLQSQRTGWYALQFTPHPVLLHHSSPPYSPHTEFVQQTWTQLHWVQQVPAEIVVESGTASAVATSRPLTIQAIFRDFNRRCMPDLVFATGGVRAEALNRSTQGIGRAPANETCRFPIHAPSSARDACVVPSPIRPTDGTFPRPDA